MQGLYSKLKSGQPQKWPKIGTNWDNSETQAIRKLTKSGRKRDRFGKFPIQNKNGFFDVKLQPLL